MSVYDDMYDLIDDAPITNMNDYLLHTDMIDLIELAERNYMDVSEKFEKLSHLTKTLYEYLSSIQTALAIGQDMCSYGMLLALCLDIAGDKIRELGIEVER